MDSCLVPKRTIITHSAVVIILIESDRKRARLSHKYPDIFVRYLEAFGIFRKILDI